MARTFVWHPSKGPAKTKAMDIADGVAVRITQVRSGIGHSWRMLRTLEALGLRHHQAAVERTMSSSLRGQLKHVRHLISVAPAKEK